MAFAKTLTSVWANVTVGTGQTGANPIARSIPRTFDVSLITTVTFATSIAEDVVINMYASNDGTTYTTAALESATFTPTNAVARVLTKEIRSKVNELNYIKFTINNPDHTYTATVSGKLVESVI